MRPITSLLALLIAVPSLADDPDEFPVIEAVPVETQGEDADPDPPPEATPLPIPNLATPQPAPSDTPELAPLPIPDLTQPNPAPALQATDALPLAIPADVSPPPAPERVDPQVELPPADEPAAEPIAATVTTTAPATVTTTAPATVTLPAPAPAPAPAPDERTLGRARPMHAAPWMPAVDKVRAWGRKAGQDIKKAVTGIGRDAEEPEVIEAEAVGADDAVPPFHAGHPIQSDDEAEPPLAIPANAPPPPADSRIGRALDARPGPPLEGPPDDPPRDDEPTDDVDRSDDDERTAGVFAGLSFGTTQILGGPGRAHALDVGMHLHRTVLLGVAGGEVADARGRSSVGWVGLRPGFVIAPDKTVHLRADMLFGIGLVEATQLPVNLFEPRVAVELSLWDWARLDAHVSYRHVPAAQPMAKDLSAPTVGVGLRLGWF